MRYGQLIGGLGVGLLLGALAASAYWNHELHNNVSTFDQNMKCSEAAKRYEREHDNRLSSVRIEQVVFSPSRNSCVAKAVETESGLSFYKVVDLLSGDYEVAGTCIFDQGECGGFMDKQDALFKWFVSSHPGEKKPF